MTMNGDHQLLAAAPLDLRTTHRDRGTLNCRGGVRDAPRPADKPSSRLPFRKRPIHLEPEADAAAGGAQPSRQRLSPAEAPPRPPGAAGPSAAAARVCPASVPPLGRDAARCWAPPGYGRSPCGVMTNVIILTPLLGDVAKSTFKRSKALQEP